MNQGVEGNDLFVCEHHGCGRSFSRARELSRHGATHNKALPRGCPYPDSKCRLNVDETNQLTNWYEHIVTVHQGYRYACGTCGKRFHRKGIYTHEINTGHLSRPKHWDSGRQEAELEMKDLHYRNARAELLRMRAEGANNAWNDSWPESLPEYTRFIRQRAVRRLFHRAQTSRDNSAASGVSATFSLLGMPNAHGQETTEDFQPYTFPVDAWGRSGAPLVTSPYASPEDSFNESAALSLHTSQNPFPFSRVPLHGQGISTPSPAFQASVQLPTSLEAASLQPQDTLLTRTEANEPYSSGVASTWEFSPPTTPAPPASLLVSYAPSVPPYRRMAPYNVQDARFRGGNFSDMAAIWPEQLQDGNR